MSKMKKTACYLLYFLFAVLVIKYNSDIVADWLNKSLFEDYKINESLELHESFFHGASLVFLLSLFLFAVFGTLTVSIILTDVLAFGLIYANQVKVLQRDEFITFSELQTIFSPKELLSFVNISPWAAVGVVCLFLLILVGIHWLLIQVLKKTGLFISWKKRTIFMVAGLLLFAAVFIKPNEYNQKVLKYEEPHSHNFNPLKRARKDGYVSTFMHTVKPTYMDQPNGYDKKKMEQLFDKYNETAATINQNRKQSLNDSQTILYLSESLMDPEELPDLLESDSPIPFIKQTSEDNIGGLMYSQYIGGGTANIEWSVLTSFSLEVFNSPVTVTPYSDFYVDSKNHSTVLNLYDHNRTAIHPYSAHLYKRRSNYSQIGFDQFLYLDHGIKHTEKLGHQTRVSDKALNKDILEVVEKEKTGLTHVLSMQNHSPYDKEITDENYHPEINTDVYPKDKEDELSNYLQSIYESDWAIQRLVEQLQDSDQEVNLVFYGDHFPNLFVGMEEQFKKQHLHQTPWFIYMNHGRSEDGMQLNDLSPAFFIPVLLRTGEYYVSPHQALMDELLTEGVKRIGKDTVVTKEGTIPDEQLSDHLKQLVQDYRLIQYDALFGQNYLTEEFFEVKR